MFRRMVPVISAGYGQSDWTWNNFFINDTIHGDLGFGLDSGHVSSTQEAFNGRGNPASLTATDPFTFVGALFHGRLEQRAADRSARPRQLSQSDSRRFRHPDIVHDRPERDNRPANGPRWLHDFQLDRYLRARFLVVRGTPAGNTNASQFVMDNFTYNPTPEPSSIILATMGSVVLLLAGLRRRAGLRHRLLSALRPRQTARAAIAMPLVLAAVLCLAVKAAAATTPNELHNPGFTANMLTTSTHTLVAPYVINTWGRSLWSTRRRNSTGRSRAVQQ